MVIKHCALFLCQVFIKFLFFQNNISIFVENKDIMSKQAKVLLKILQGLADKNISFDDLISLLKRLGFSERISGGHYIFFKEGIAEIINLQPNNESKAKPYQVKQVREIIEKYNLTITKFDDND